MHYSNPDVYLSYEVSYIIYAIILWYCLHYMSSRFCIHTVTFSWRYLNSWNNVRLESYFTLSAFITTVTVLLNVMKFDVLWNLCDFMNREVRLVWLFLYALVLKFMRDLEIISSRVTIPSTHESTWFSCNTHAIQRSKASVFSYLVLYNYFHSPLPDWRGIICKCYAMICTDWYSPCGIFSESGIKIVV